MNHSQIRWGPDTLKWIYRRNNENLVLFYSYELKKIQDGADAQLLLTNRERRRLKEAGIITYNMRNARSVEILPWAVNILSHKRIPSRVAPIKIDAREQTK